MGLPLALGIALAALAVQGCAGLAEALQWQRGAGSALTWLTGHLTHWSWNHLVWDLLAFALLSGLSLRLAASRYAPCLLLASALIPLEILWCHPGLECYRGLSGLDCALFGLVIAALWRRPSGHGRWSSAQSLALLGGVAFMAKTCYELATGGTLFVEPGAAAFVPVISAHLTGFVSGCAVGLIDPAGGFSVRKPAYWKPTQ